MSEPMDIERYTVQQFITALAVDTNTARAWLADQHIKPTRDEYDGRRKWISSADAHRVAKAHGRTLLAVPDDAYHSSTYFANTAVSAEGDIRVDYTAICTTCGNDEAGGNYSPDFKTKADFIVHLIDKEWWYVRDQGWQCNDCRYRLLAKIEGQR